MGMDVKKGKREGKGKKKWILYDTSISEAKMRQSSKTLNSCLSCHSSFDFDLLLQTEAIVRIYTCCLLWFQ